MDNSSGLGPVFTGVLGLKNLFLDYFSTMSCLPPSSIIFVGMNI